MSSLPIHTPPLAASSSGAPPTLDDPLAALWRETLERFEDDAKLKLILPTGTLASKFDSADAIFDFLDAHRTSFGGYREAGDIQLSGRLRHIVAVVGTLSSGIGEGVGIPFEPGKVIFAAIGESIKAALAVEEDFDTIYAAFDTMEQQLRIIQPAVGEDINSSLREPSVKLLAQILRVLGVITKLQQDGRFRTWLKKLAQSKAVSAALDDLRRLATNHHQTVSAVTLATAQKTLAILMDGVKDGAQDQDINRRCLASIAQLAQDVYDEILRGSSVTSKEIQDIRGSLENIHDILLNHVDSSKRSTGMAGICSWLQYQDCSPRLNDLLHHRVPSTGAWFLDGADFAALKSGSKRALWLQGKAGCGKSTLIAGAIQDLRVYCLSQDPQLLVLQHLFDATNGSHHRNLRTLFASLLCQLSHSDHESLSALSGLRENHMSGNSQPSLAALQHQLDSLLDNIPGHAFVVVDALDEADDVDVIKLLEHLSTRPDVRLLLSSRGEVLFYDRLHGLCDETIIIGDALVKDDIGTVIHGALNQGGALERVSKAMSSLVREALVTGADGSFRWTVLQIQELSGISGIPKKVRQRLEMLPKTLSEAYEQCLQAIQPEDRADVRILLTWLLMSYEPLSTRDFALLLAFDYSGHMPVFDASLKPSPMDTVSLMGSTFVSVHDDKVRFAHASARDFLLALPPTSGFHIDAGLAYALMARTGIAYVNHSSSWIPRLHLSPGWVRYVNMAGGFHYDELEPDITMALNNAQREPDMDIALCDALHLAAEIGHVRLVKLLHDKGRGIDALSGYWRQQSALYRAIDRSQHEVSLLLIELGASPTSSRLGDESALDIAIKRKHQDIIKAIIDRYSADVDVWSHISRSALQVAVDYGDYDVAALLISRGADVSADEQFASDIKLHHAVERGYEDIIKLLLDQQGIDIEAYDDYHNTALHTAAMNGAHSIAALLIARDDGTSPLDVIGRNTWCRDAEKEGRIRAMLLRAGATEDAPQVVVSTVQDAGGGEAEGTREKGTPAKDEGSNAGDSNKGDSNEGISGDKDYSARPGEGVRSFSRHLNGHLHGRLDGHLGVHFHSHFDDGD
ncbi:hypothetical protein EV715DRAFT_292550 [Schizophyllum commune]